MLHPYVWHDTYIWVTSHVQMPCIHVEMSHATHTTESRRTNWKRQTSATAICDWTRHVTHMNASRHTYECITSHIWMRHVTHRRGAPLGYTVAKGVCCPHVAVCCGVLRCVAVCCSVLQCGAEWRRTFVALSCGFIAVCCGFIAVCCGVAKEAGRNDLAGQFPWNTLQHTATRCNTLQHTATYLTHKNEWCRPIYSNEPSK